MTGSKEDFFAKWAFIVSANGMDDEKRKEMEHFAEWFMAKLQLEGALIGHHFNYEETPVMSLETEVDNFESCTNAYQSIQKQHPQVVLVIHVLPQPSSNEYEWMKTLAQRYGFLRQGILIDNAVKKFEGLELSVESVFRNMCQWIYKSGLAIVRGEANACGLLIGKDSKPTVEKVLFNSEDIREAVNKVLHQEDVARGSEAESSIRVSGYPEMLNSFGIAQLLSPFRVISVSIEGPQEAIVLLENKFQAYQAVRDLDHKKLSRNNTLNVSAVGTEVVRRLHNKIPVAP